MALLIRRSGRDREPAIAHQCVGVDIAGRFAMAQRRQPTVSDPPRAGGGSRKRRAGPDRRGSLDHESAARWISPKRR
jgi:hypothetical protein